MSNIAVIDTDTSHKKLVVVDDTDDLDRFGWRSGASRVTRRVTTFWTEFKAFIFKGSVVDLAVSGLQFKCFTFSIEFFFSVFFFDFAKFAQFSH